MVQDDDRQHTTDDATRRLVEAITEQIEGHVQHRVRPRPAVRRSTAPRVHQAPTHLTVFTGNVYAQSLHTGNAASDDIVQARRKLQTVLDRLPEAGLSQDTECSVRRDLGEALAETDRVQPQPRQLRRLIIKISTALVMAGGGVNPVIAELVEHLQRIAF